MDTVRAWPRHLHEMRQCARGARALAESLGLDYAAFVREGLPVAQLRATGNAFALALAEHAEAQAAAALTEAEATPPAEPEPAEEARDGAGQ